MEKQENNMVYLRKKNIYGNNYWYLCRSKRVDREVKQEIVSYIGSCGSVSEQEAEQEKRRVQDKLEQNKGK